MNHEPTIVHPLYLTRHLGVENRLTRYEALDAIRGLLALAIVWQHCRWLANAGVEHWLDKSQLIVNVFFVLAGFSLGLSKPREYGKFIWSKAKRLYPAYLIALAFAYLLSPEQNRAALLVDLTGLQGLIPYALWPDGDSILPVAWFVSVLVQFYLIAPFFMRLKTVPLVIVFILSLIVLAHPLNWRLYVWYSPLGSFLLQKMYLLLGGMVLYRVWPSFGNWRMPLVFRPLLWAGSISYALFLIHFPILRSIWDANPSLGALLFAGVPASVLFAMLLTRITE